MNDLYRNELRLFKNFFQPVMKLERKIRIKGKIHRRYDKPLTPYRRILASSQVSEEVKEKLKEVYWSLNSAKLKRDIDIKIKRLYTGVQKEEWFKNNCRRKEINSFYGVTLYDKTTVATVSWLYDLTCVSGGVFNLWNNHATAKLQCAMKKLNCISIHHENLRIWMLFKEDRAKR